MKKFELCRSYLPDRTVGIFKGEDLRLASLERPWFENKINISCIPEGAYLVKRDKHGRHQWYAVQDVEGRTSIELHIGNKVHDSNGCILLGLNFSEKHDINLSSVAMRRLLETVGDDDFILSVRAATASDWF